MASFGVHNKYKIAHIEEKQYLCRMETSRKAKCIAWCEQHPELVTRPSMKRRKDDHDYTGRCIYLITVCVEGRRSLFGELHDADTNHATPWVYPSPLGMSVINQWSAIGIEHPQIKSLAFQLMPDHIHGILFVTEKLPRHLGHYVSRFKSKSTQAMHGMSLYSETQSRTEALWEEGYNDRILTGKGQLQDWVNFLHDNPRRLWVKRNHLEWFTAHHGMTIGLTTTTVMGNQFLLNYPYKVAVQCSRRMTAADIETACNRYLSMARDGAVLVSPCISPGEKEVMHRAFDAGLPQIILLENGFAPLQKPSGRQFDACADGRVLLVAPWPHHNDKRTITREQCLALNKLAEEITQSYETAFRITPT